MDNVNYKIIDTQKIIDYIESCRNSILVDNLIKDSGADKLRVYPALFELEQSGYIEVIKRDFWGTPLIIRKRNIEINDR